MLGVAVHWMLLPWLLELKPAVVANARMAMNYTEEGGGVVNV